MQKLSIIFLLASILFLTFTTIKLRNLENTIRKIVQVQGLILMSQGELLKYNMGKIEEEKYKDGISYTNAPWASPAGIRFVRTK